MPRIRIPRPFALTAAALTLSCTADPLVICACSRVPPYAMVYGRVTLPDGGPADGVRVRVETGPAGCQAWTASEEGAADAAGRYRVPAFRTGAERDQCVRAFALAPAGSGLRGSDTAQFAVRFPGNEANADSVSRGFILRQP